MTDHNFSPASNRRVLLIGGAGYIGVPVARQLVEAGYLVRTLDRLVYQNGSSLLGHTPRPTSEIWVTVRLSTARSTGSATS
jgi:nucleoside-diphosphate-sugar epimerase